MTNPIVQWQVITQDPAKHSAFYADLLGWKIDGDNRMAYRQTKIGDGIEGGFWPAPEGTNPFVQLYVRVDDVRATFERAVELGCSPIAPPQALPDGAMLAILHDPQGMSFGLMSSQKA